jgi:hypothetical protein
MAYKDEYEVARLHADPQFAQAIREQFEGDYHLVFHLGRHRCSHGPIRAPARRKKSSSARGC